MKLSDACTIFPGGTPKTSIRKYWNGAIPWISIKDFSDANKYISCTEKTITQDGFENCVSAMLKQDDIILSARGSVGKTAMLQCPMAFNQSCFGLRSKNKDLSQQFLFYWLRSHSNIFRASKQGNIFKTITRDFFDFTEIDYPRLPTQLRIAGILGSLDEKIEINRRKIAELEALAKLIYDHWFIQFDFPDANGKPYKSSGGKMVWNETLKRDIPDGWEVDNIYRIADYINGLACQKYRPSSKLVALPVIKIKEMHDGITDETEFVSSDIPEHYKISDGSMLFSWSATLETMIWTGGNAGLNQHIFKVVPHNGFPMSFVFLQVSAYIGNFVKMADARKTTMGHITTDHMKQSRILIPSQALLNAFSSVGQPIFDKIIKNRKEIIELTRVRDWLLPMLMNGQTCILE